MKKELVKKEISLTNTEYSRLFSGASPMETYDLSSKGIRELTFCDGPSGVRKEDANGDSLAGISKTLPSTCFPAGSSLASSFDKELLSSVGKAIGEEASYYGVDVLLGPAINIMRNPLGGRNFEYYSEDPFLAGSLGASYVKGVQSEGVGACLKHFAANNNEKNRFVGDSVIDERALHDIYLKPFEMVVKEGKPYAIMSAYNKLNGTFCSQNGTLLNDTLRKQWGFNGVVMTDWGGIVSRPFALNNGCDLEMPGMSIHNINSMKKALDDKTVSQEVASISAERIKRLGALTSSKKKEPHFKEHASLALKAALEGAILLKNDGTLPLNEDNDICIIGSLYGTPRYQGSGSSMLNPISFISHQKAFASNNLQ
jgi:beta-glucosidase